MRFKTFSLILLFIILFSCKNEEPIISFKEISFSITNNNIVELNTLKAIGNPKIAERINTILEEEVSRSLNTYDDDNTDLRTITENINSFNKQFEIFKSDFPESKQVWEAQIDGELLFQSNEILSISITSYINTGGAHGNLNITLLNFNAETGDLIPSKALFNDLETLKKVARPYFLKSIENKEVPNNKIQGFTLPKNMALNEDGVILLYNTYEIAPYSTGIIEFTVPFEDINSLLVFNNFQ